jgi:hypothetical protein
MKSRFIQLTGVLGVLFTVTTILWKAEKEQNQYVAQGIEWTVNGLRQDIEKLHDQFEGDLNHLVKSVELVMIKPELNLLDMLMLGESAVLPKWQQEYHNLKLAMPNQYVHIHEGQNTTHYIAAGIKLVSIETQNQGIQLVLQGVQNPIARILKTRFKERITEFPATIEGTRNLRILLVPKQN